MAYILLILEMGKEVQKDSATGPGSVKWQSWDSNVGLLTLALNEIKRDNVCRVFE